jgi:hypothetical protein
MPACFVVGEGNISIQENEFVPFRWRIEGDKNFATSCTDNSIGKIRKNSLECEFKLFNGKLRESGK